MNIVIYRWQLALLSTIFFLLLVVTANAQSLNNNGVWQGFFDQKDLQRTLTLTAPGIQENFTEVILPRLSSTEKKALAGVELKFPLEDGSHIINFYAANRTIYMPVSSLRFLVEISMASAYLNRNNYNIQTLADYLSVLKYQWPAKLRDEHYQPLRALGLPPLGQYKPDVLSLWEKTFSYAALFVLCHELGHLFYQHPGYNKITPEKARNHEGQADQFALNVLRRTGDPIHGGVFFFFWASELLQPNSSDPAFVQNQILSTHPLNATRIRAVAKDLQSHVKYYAAKQPDPKKAEEQFTFIVDQLKLVAAKLEDPEALALTRVNGISGDIRLLSPVKYGQAISKNKIIGNSHRPFSGTFAGEWIDPQGNKMPLTLMLQWQNNTVKGHGILNNTGKISIINGKTDKNKMYFSWEMGDQYFGKGELEANPEGNKLLGTWGTKKGQTLVNSGQWVLTRKK